jgi:hypothetical protein
MERPGALSCCVRDRLALNNSPQEIKTILRPKRATGLLTSSPICQQVKDPHAGEYAHLRLTENDGFLLFIARCRFPSFRSTVSVDREMIQVATQAEVKTFEQGRG